jgi:hypothetical protein
VAFLAGCLGSDEEAEEYVAEKTLKLCIDGLDNDGDGDYDCYDTECRKLDSSLIARGVLDSALLANNVDDIVDDHGNQLFTDSSGNLRFCPHEAPPRYSRPEASSSDEASSEASSSSDGVSSEESSSAAMSYPAVFDGINFPLAQVNGLAFDGDSYIGFSGKKGDNVLMGVINSANGELERMPQGNVEQPGEGYSLSWSDSRDAFFTAGRDGSQGRFYFFRFDDVFYTNISTAENLDERYYADVAVDPEQDICVAENVVGDGQNTSSHVIYYHIDGNSMSGLALAELNTASEYTAVIMENNTYCTGVGYSGVAGSRQAMIARVTSVSEVYKQSFTVGATNEEATDILFSQNSYFVTLNSDESPYLVKLGLDGTVSSSVALGYTGTVRQVIELSDGRFLTIGTMGTNAVVALVASDLSSASLYNTDGIAGPGEGTSAVQVNDGRVYVSGNNGAGQGWIDIIEP